MVNGWSPLALSLWVSSLAGLAALVLGVALAWLLVRRNFRGKSFLEGLTLLSLVLPPTVLGYYLLVLLGQRGLGPFIEGFLGIRFVFAWPGAVVAASITALPLVLQTVRVSFAEISKEIEDAARVDGCSEWQLFWRVMLPIAWRGILAGGLLGFLRALGEFGATLMVAGNIPGRTQTLSMAIYDAVQANNLARANGLALLLTGMAFGMLFLVLRLNRRIVGI
ncbi:MAG TPA: molybdate ABC transporter permease subunit [Anaerolineales bacterium]